MVSFEKILFLRRFGEREFIWGMARTAVEITKKKKKNQQWTMSFFLKLEGENN